jgi:hypothetical protein
MKYKMSVFFYPHPSFFNLVETTNIMKSRCSHCPFIHHEGLQSFQHSFPCHVFKLYLIVLALIHNYMNLKILCKLYMSCIYGADMKSNSTCHVIMVLTRNQTLHVMYLWCWQEIKLYMSCIYGADKKSNSTCHVFMVLTRNQTLHVMYLWCW